MYKKFKQAVSVSSQNFMVKLIFKLVKSSIYKGLRIKNVMLRHLTPANLA